MPECKHTWDKSWKQRHCTFSCTGVMVSKFYLAFCFFQLFSIKILFWQNRNKLKIWNLKSQCAQWQAISMQIMNVIGYLFLASSQKAWKAKKRGNRKIALLRSSQHLLRQILRKEERWPTWPICNSSAPHRLALTTRN